MRGGVLRPEDNETDVYEMNHLSVKADLALSYGNKGIDVKFETMAASATSTWAVDDTVDEITLFCTE